LEQKGTRDGGTEGFGEDQNAQTPATSLTVHEDGGAWIGHERTVQAGARFRILAARPGSPRGWRVPIPRAERGEAAAG